MGLPLASSWASLFERLVMGWLSDFWNGPEVCSTTAYYFNNGNCVSIKA